MTLCKRLWLTLILVMTIGLAATSNTYAAELCSATEEKCAEKNVYKEGTVVKAPSTEAVFVTGITTTTCKESAVEIETAAEAGNPLPGTLIGLSFSGCTAGETKCEVSALNLVYYISIEETGTNKGTVTLTDAGEGIPSVSIVCGGVKCTYGAKEVALAMAGGKPATLSASNVVLEKLSGASCAAEAKWTAKYSTNSPESVNLAAAPGKLCKMALTELGTCPTGQGYTGNIESDLVTGTEAKLISTLGPTGTISCAEATLKGENFGANGQGKIAELFLETAGPCTSTLNGKPAVDVAVEVLPFNLSSFVYRTTTKAIFVAHGGNPKRLKLTIELPMVKTCLYRYSRMSWYITGYSPMKIDSQWSAVALQGNPAECPQLLEFKSVSTVKRPGGGNLWVSKN